MNEELFQLLEAEFLKNRIEEEVEDLLLELSEALADMKVVGQELVYRATVGYTKLEICGICEADEEDQEEISVYVRTFKIGDKEFEIEDYLL